MTVAFEFSDLRRRLTFVKMSGGFRSTAGASPIASPHWQEEPPTGGLVVVET